MIGNRFISANMIFHGIKFGKIKAAAKMDAYLGPAPPIAQHLFRQIMDQQTGNKDGHYLGLRLFNNLAHARLRGQKCVWIIGLIARAFRMKSDDMTDAMPAKFSEPARGITIEDLLFGILKYGRIHRPEPHHQIDKHPQPTLVEKTRAHGKEETFLPARILIEHRRNDIHIKEGAMIRNEQHWTGWIDGGEVLQPVKTHEVISADIDPESTKDLLAPGPEALLFALIHGMDKTKKEPFPGGEHGQLFRSRIDRTLFSYLCSDRFAINVRTLHDPFLI